MRKYFRLWLCAIVAGLLFHFTSSSVADERSNNDYDGKETDRIAWELKDVKFDALTKLNYENPEVKTSYALGLSEGINARAAMLDLEGTSVKLDYKAVVAGFLDGIKNMPGMDQETFDQVYNMFVEQAQAALKEKEEQRLADEDKNLRKNLAVAKRFMAENKTKQGVVALASGLQYKVLKSGMGQSPSLSSKVKINYSGHLIDGSEFDSTYKNNQPLVISLGTTIKGWKEALTLMKPGDKWRLYIPPELGYGEMAYSHVPGNSVLIFDIELLEVIKG
jgi:FKBP-type peptidyl-prolyl cis-trans isomerase